jgi:hypothetical protein
VVKETVEGIQIVIVLAEKDALNIIRCFAFISEKYPHAIFSGEDFSIGVDNLTSVEIDDCLSQKDLKFTYYKDKNL